MPASQKRKEALPVLLILSTHNKRYTRQGKSPLGCEAAIRRLSDTPIHSYKAQRIQMAADSVVLQQKPAHLGGSEPHRR